MLAAFFRHRGWPLHGGAHAHRRPRCLRHLSRGLDGRPGVAISRSPHGRAWLARASEDATHGGRALVRAARARPAQGSRDPVHRQRRHRVARVLLREAALGGTPPTRRARKDQRAEKRARPAPHGVAGAGRTAFPVQHAGVGAIAGDIGSATRRADHRCAGAAPARHAAQDPRRHRTVAVDTRRAVRDLRELSRVDEGAPGRAPAVRAAAAAASFAKCRSRRCC